MGKSVLLRNNVKITGEGDTTILFAHGFGCDQNMWRFVIPEFEKKYRVVLFDYVGCGNSDLSAYTPDRYGTLDGYAQDVLDVCDALNLSKVIFIGHSVSCVIGMLASISRPDLFRAMVLIGPSARYINDSGYFGGFDKNDLEELMDVMEKNYIGWASFLAPVVMKNSDRPELTQELEESFCSTDPIITKNFARATFFSDNRGDLAKVSVPVFVMQCSDDAIAPGEVGDYVARHIKNSQIVKMEATGHCPHVSHPEETVLLIRGYLDNLN